MEPHSPITAKRLWNFLRVAFFMMRKGLISKRKLVMDMNLMMKRGKIMGKNIRRSLVFHHPHRHHRRPSRGYGFSLREYEFSCTNSPNPVFFHAKRRHNYFPCINAVVEEADETPRPNFSVPRIEYTPSPSPSPQCLALSQELAAVEAKSPQQSPFSVRISNFSEDDGVGEGSSCDEKVDDDAEQFIKMFYEQLRAQSRIALIQYQEMEVQEMLARGR